MTVVARSFIVYNKRGYPKSTQVSRYSSPAAALGSPCRSPAAEQEAGRRSAGSTDALLGTGADFSGNSGG